MKKLITSLAVAAMLSSPAFAFNLWEDIQANTNWMLGQSVAAGTAVALRSCDAYRLKAGEFTGSALAQIANYRFLSAWFGGTFIPVENGEMKAIDTAKIGLNVAYVFKGFANQPPEVIRNLVIGPSISMPLFSSPHVAVPFLDINYAFGGTGASNVNTPPAPSVPVTSKLNLLRAES